MKHRRLKVSGNVSAVYHCMTRTVNGEHLFAEREKEVLRKMIWQVADFSGVEVLTYCVMANHFHVLVRVPAVTASGQDVSDEELLRRYQVLYPKPTKYQTASIELMQKELAKNTDAALAIRGRLLARMGDVSEFMKTLKQRFSVWYNRSHERFGTLWAARFKSVLVEGRGNPLQTMAAYIDLNPVRAGLVEDPKDYRFCGYAEAVAQSAALLRQPNTSAADNAVSGIRHIWQAYADGTMRRELPVGEALQMHRELIFGRRAGQAGLTEAARQHVLKVLEQEDALLPRATVLRCRVRYFTDGAILGSQEYVRDFVEAWQLEKGRKHPPKPQLLRGADWSGLATIQSLKNRLFG